MVKSMRLSVFFLMSILLFWGCSKEYTPEQVAEESKRINDFFAEVFERNVERYPTWQTYLGLKTSYGSLDNETMEYAEEQRKLDKEDLKKLKKFNVDALDKQAKISYQVFKHKLEQSIEGWEWRYHSYPLNQMFGYQSSTPSFLINMHRVSEHSDLEAYISRLKEIKRVFDERLVFVKEQRKRGIVAPHFTFEKVIEDSRNIITGKPFEKGEGDSPLFEDFKKKMNSLELSAEQQKKLLKQARVALEKFVEPAYKELIAYVEALADEYQQNDGVWSLPKGKNYYQYRLKKMTTTDMTAKEIHELGLREVARIHGEMEKIKQQVGFEGELTAFFEHVKNHPKLTYSNDESGRKAYLKEATNAIEQMKKALPKMFNTLPKAELTVKAVEPYREKTAGTAFYQGPSLYGDRPGIYYVNLYKMEDNPKYMLEALAYHEGLPGHHMQIAIQTELEDLPKFRRTGGFTAYSEGWGLYAERLPKEFGFYQDPYSDFGRLSMELWRAARLVIDTGIHHKKWTREQAISYFKENTPNAELKIQKEVERYFVMPAQATTYKIGMEKILSLRAMAREKLKDKFDLKKFHDIVLRNGALPLNILAQEVEQWIKKELAN